LLLFWDRISLCSSGCPQIADPPEYWDYRHVPPHLTLELDFDQGKQVPFQGLCTAAPPAWQFFLHKVTRLDPWLFESISKTSSEAFFDHHSYFSSQHLSQPNIHHIYLPSLYRYIFFGGRGLLGIESRDTHSTIALQLYLFTFFCGIGVWTQDLHLEPLHQPFFVLGIFKTGSQGINCPGLASNCEPPYPCLLSS
jgi:hypothetical protein